MNDEVRISIFNKGSGLMGEQRNPGVMLAGARNCSTSESESEREVQVRRL